MSTCSSFFSISSSSWILKKNRKYIKLTTLKTSFNSSYACSCECKLCTSSFRLSTIATSSFNSSPSRSLCASDFRQSSTAAAARNSRFNNSNFRSKLFSCSLQKDKNQYYKDNSSHFSFLPTHKIFNCICRRISAFFLLTSVNHWANSCSSDSSESAKESQLDDILDCLVQCHSPPLPPITALSFPSSALAFKSIASCSRSSASNSLWMYETCGSPLGELFSTNDNGDGVCFASPPLMNLSRPGLELFLLLFSMLNSPGELLLFAKFLLLLL